MPALRRDSCLVGHGRLCATCMDVQGTHKIVKINSLQSEQEQGHAGTEWRSGGFLPAG